MTIDPSKGVTLGQLVFALLGELVLFIGWIVIDRLATEERTTRIEERVNAIYNALPQMRAGVKEQNDRLTELEHQILKMEAMRNGGTAPKR